MPTLPPSFLVRVSVPVGSVDGPFNWKTADRLTPLPDWKTLDGDGGELKLAAGWSDEGLIFAIDVRSAKPPIGKVDDPTKGDSVVLCVDTRDTKSIRRAGRFCHRFRVVPNGKDAYVRQEPVPRAREDATFGPSKSEAVLKTVKGGYRLLVRLDASNLTGFAPADSPRLGLFAATYGRDGSSHGMVGDDKLPMDADPSLWTSIELVDAVE